MGSGEEIVEFADYEGSVEYVKEEVEGFLGVDALVDDGVVDLSDEANGEFGQRLAELYPLSVAVLVSVPDVELDLPVELDLLDDPSSEGVEGLLDLPVFSSYLGHQLLSMLRNQPKIPLLVFDQLGISGYLPSAKSKGLLELFSFE